MVYRQAAARYNAAVLKDLERVGMAAAGRGVFLATSANLSLRTRLILSFVLVSLIPLLLFGMVSYKTSTDVIENMVIDSGARLAERACAELDSLFFEAIDQANAVAVNPFIQRTLRMRFATRSERYSMDLNAANELLFVSKYRKNIFGLYVIGENGGVYKSNYCSIRDGLLGSSWYDAAADDGKPVWFDPHVDSFAVFTDDERLISFCIPVLDKATGSKVGVILTDIREQLVLDIIHNRVEPFSNLFVQYSEEGVIALPGQVPARDDLLRLSKHEQLEQGAPLRLNSEETIIVKRMASTGWALVCVINTRRITHNNSRSIMLMIALTLAVISLISIAAALYISSSVASPIKKLILLMRKVEEGDWSVKMDFTRIKEIEQLSHSFNVMVEKLKSLMNDFYLEQVKLRKAELTALQAQINPHFLYNTLDTISWLARRGRKEETTEIVGALTRLFRIGISRGQDIIPIREEIHHIRSYLTIQHLRYRKKFDYSIEIRPDLENYYTLKLILQPIVENAIYHGVKMKREKGFIRIAGREEANTICFEVSDDGPGMSRSDLAALENRIKNGEGAKLEGYGLKNIQDRINIFFGAGYGLSFRSQPGEYFAVRVVIPKMREGHEGA